MAEAARPATKAPKPSTASTRVLLVMVVANHDVLDDVVTGLLDLGVPGTVLEARGLMSLMREEMPIFSGLAAMLPETGGSRVVLSYTTREQANSVFRFVNEEFEAGSRPIAFTLAVDATAEDMRTG